MGDHKLLEAFTWNPSEAGHPADRTLLVPRNRNIGQWSAGLPCMPLAASPVEKTCWNSLAFGSNQSRLPQAGHGAS